MTSTSVRQPLSIHPAATRYENALKLRIGLSVAGIIFGFSFLFCCPIIVAAQMMIKDPTMPPAVPTAVITSVATKAINPTRTPMPVLATVTSRPFPSPTSESYPIAVISCADKLYKVNLRRTPGYQNKDNLTDSIYEIPCGEYVELLGDKQNVDGLTWWRIKWNDLTGWVADHTASGKTILIFNP